MERPAIARMIVRSVDVAMWEFEKILYSGDVNKVTLGGGGAGTERSAPDLYFHELSPHRKTRTH